MIFGVDVFGMYAAMLQKRSEMADGALVIEDNQMVLNAYGLALAEKGYNVRKVFYEGAETEIPSDRFNLVVVGGLEGDCVDVLDKINADKVIVISEDDQLIKKVSSMGFLAASSRGSVASDVVKLAEVLA